MTIGGLHFIYKTFSFFSYLTCDLNKVVKQAFCGQIRERKEGIFLKKVRSLRVVLRQFVSENPGLFWCVAALFFCGVLASALYCFRVPAERANELHVYMNDFFFNMQQNGADSFWLFKTGVLKHIWNFIFVILCSLMLCGAPLIAIFASVKGFLHGFTWFFVFRAYGIRALLFVSLGMLPHYLVIAPCYMILLVQGMQFSTLMLKERQEIKYRLIRYITTCIILMLCAIAATLLQAYVEPLLIRLISGVYTG